MSGSPRSPWWRRWFGSRSERAAARYLKGQGLRLVARNYQCAHGELDLVAGIIGKPFDFEQVIGTIARVCSESAVRV